MKHATPPDLRYLLEASENRERILNLSIDFTYWILIIDRISERYSLGFPAGC